MDSHLRARYTWVIAADKPDAVTYIGNGHGCDCAKATSPVQGVHERRRKRGEREQSRPICQFERSPRDGLRNDEKLETDRNEW